VSVDGEVVHDLGRRVDPSSDRVEVDGSRVVLDERRRYWMLNKPAGVVSTAADPAGRPTVVGMVPEQPRVFPVGRLDRDTEGLLLLTNDGELAHRLMHPSYEVFKTYLAQVPGPVPRDLGRRLRAGVMLDDGPVAVHVFRVVDATPGLAMVELVLHEGRRHIVRRLLESVGHPVQRLVRTAIDAVRLGEQRPGSLRALSRAEIAALHQAVDL